MVEIVDLMVGWFFVASSELSVQKAKSEITRLIKEELVRLVSILLYQLLLHLFQFSTFTAKFVSTNQQRKIQSVIKENWSSSSQAINIFITFSEIDNE